MMNRTLSTNLGWFLKESIEEIGPDELSMDESIECILGEDAVDLDQEMEEI